jgi:class 3 adenylate cyclase
MMFQPCFLAVAMRERFADLSADWRKRGYVLEIGIGMATGFATLGRIGFEGRYDYGAVGSVLNLASRLCDAAEPGQIVIGPRVLAEVEELVEATPLGTLELKGFGRPVEAFAVTSLLPVRT